MVNFIFCSCGNDSVALIQLMREQKPDDRNIVVYSDTGWSADFWLDRVEQVKTYVEKCGMEFAVTESEGMLGLVQRKKIWPMPASPMQFCTDELKAKPAREYMIEVDPDLEAKCYTGIRREESKNRENAPGFIEQSDRHGGRDLFCPMVDYTASDRDELLTRAGFKVLPHQSMECFPCVCSNRSDFRMLSKYPDRIELIAKTEERMGYTKKGKPRTMFRPYRHMGATGIHEVVRWSLFEKGKYHKEDEDQISYLRCTSGFCNM